LSDVIFHLSSVFYLLPRFSHHHHTYLVCVVFWLLSFLCVLCLAEKDLICQVVVVLWFFINHIISDQDTHIQTEREKERDNIYFLPLLFKFHNKGLLFVSRHRPRCASRSPPSSPSSRSSSTRSRRRAPRGRERRLAIGIAGMCFFSVHHHISTLPPFPSNLSLDISRHHTSHNITHPHIYILALELTNYNKTKSKPSCAWPRKGNNANPVQTCDKNDKPLNDGGNTRSGCDSGGNAFMCSNQSPWAVNETVAYGWAAVNIAGSNEANWCCACYELTFTSGPVQGKKMVVQATNTGGDLGNNHFDIAVSFLFFFFLFGGFGLRGEERGRSGVEERSPFGISSFLEFPLSGVFEFLSCLYMSLSPFLPLPCLLL